MNNNTFKYWATKPHNEADPYVVALAKTKGLIVITYESPDSPKKIPAACLLQDIECVTFLGFLRKENFKLNSFSIE